MDSYHAFIAEMTHRDRMRDRLAEVERERLARQVEGGRGLAGQLVRRVRAALIRVEPGQVRDGRLACPAPPVGATPIHVLSNALPVTCARDGAPVRPGSLEEVPGDWAEAREPAQASLGSRPASSRLDGRHLRARYGR